jgi:hypothetical protein
MMVTEKLAERLHIACPFKGTQIFAKRKHALAKVTAVHMLRCGGETTLNHGKA